MTWSSGIRQTHRWVSIAFVATVAANVVAMALGKPPAWVTYSPLAPLAFLALSGLYMFARPYVHRTGRPLEGRKG